MLETRAMWRLPYCVRISLKVFILLIVIQTIARIIFYNYAFHETINGLFFKTFFLGLRYDARVAAIIALPLMILLFFTPLHTYVKKRQTLFFTAIFALISSIVTITYVVDFYFYDYKNDRLNASILNDIVGVDKSNGVGMVSQSHPIFRTIIVAAIVVLLLTKLFKKIFTNTIKYPKYKPVWKTIAVVSLSIIIYAYIIIGNIIFYPGQAFPLKFSDAATLGNPASKVAMNPFQSFVSSLKYTNTSYHSNSSSRFSIDLYNIQPPNELLLTINTNKKEKSVITNEIIYRSYLPNLKLRKISSFSNGNLFSNNIGYLDSVTTVIFEN